MVANRVASRMSPRLRNWLNKRICEMCWVTMCQSFVHQISSASSQKRTGVFLVEYYLASRTLLWASHVARMPKSRLLKRPILSWVHEPRIAGGQEMTYGRSLERHLKYFGLVDDGGKAITSSEWETLAQDRAGWLKLVTKAPFNIGKPQLRPRCGTRVTTEEKRRFLAWRAQETCLNSCALPSMQKQTQKQLKSGFKIIS